MFAARKQGCPKICVQHRPSAAKNARIKKKRTFFFSFVTQGLSMVNYREERANASDEREVSY